MITINTISPTRFSFNGVTYHKNFMPFVTGNKIAIINVYDGCITLTDAPTIFSDYTVNGVTYSSVNDLQSVLLDVIYTRNSLTNAAITLTTTGNSGAATLTGITLNIPNYTLAGLGGVGGTGTNNFLPKFTGASTLGNSLIFDNGTNVGIGTTSPSGALHVNKFGTYCYFESNANGVYPANIQGISFGWNASAGGGETIIAYNKGGGSTGGLVFANNDGGSYAERMRITSGGNVGIGTTSPAERLSVSGAIISTGGITGHGANRTSLSQEGGNGAYWQSYGANTSTVGEFNFRQASSDFSINRIAMYINSSGNVGIGTTAPSQRLDVNGLINSTNGISVGGEGVSRFWTGTQAQYDAITTKVSTTVYLIT